MSMGILKKLAVIACGGIVDRKEKCHIGAQIRHDSGTGINEMRCQKTDMESLRVWLSMTSPFSPYFLHLCERNLRICTVAKGENC